LLTLRRLEFPISPGKKLSLFQRITLFIPEPSGLAEDSALCHQSSWIDEFAAQRQQLLLGEIAIEVSRYRHRKGYLENC
jgi:hypothetical protein